jgi:predicted dehydrogenase
MAFDGDPVRIGLVGLGARGESTARCLAAESSVDFRAAADLMTERRQTAREEFGVETYADATEMFTDADIEAVVVVTRASSHAPMATAAMKAGNHVLCEKPLAETVADGREMAAAARRTGQVGAVNFQQRFDPLHWTLRGTAADLDPLQVLLTYQRGMFRDRYLRPGYAYGILDGAIHRIDRANDLVGRTPRAVSATLDYGSFSGAEAVDASTIQIEYADDRAATVQASMGGEGLDAVCQVVGTLGNVQQSGDALTVNDGETDDEGVRSGTSTRRVDLTPPPGDEAPADVAQEDMALKRAFAARVRGGAGGALASFEDGLDALLVAKAAVRSHERGETVYLSDLREEQSSV